jgi:hypothetical protein
LLLRRNLTDHFSDQELRALCSEIGVDYERLRGQGKAAKASELVRQLSARARIPELVALAARERPNISWGDVPTALRSGQAPPERSGTSSSDGWAGWVVAIVVTGLVFVLRGRLRPGYGAAPDPALGAKPCADI